MKKAIVTGAAGFVGSNLVERLLKEGVDVVGVDNLSTGRREFIKEALENPHFRLAVGDLQDREFARQTFTGEVDWVFHLAANADVRYGFKHPRKDLEQNVIVTWNVLDAMREANIKNIAFSSTGAVYGETNVFPTPENCPMPTQTSLYAASKMSAECFIQAYAEGAGIRACIFRFVSLLGARYSHGHVFDFVRLLRKDPTRLPVLGNGTQRKSYLAIRDCIDAILIATQARAYARVEAYNLGTDEHVTVNDSIRVIVDELKLSPAIEYAGGDRGWVGDNPYIFLDCKKMRALGWAPKFRIEEGIRQTVRYVAANEWLF